MAPLPPLASLDDLAVATGLEPTDPNVELALRRASGRFRLEVGHPVSLVEDEVIEIPGDGGRLLLLPAVPVTSIAVVHGNVALVEKVDYTVKRREGILTRYAGWTAHTVVTYTHGWAEIPEGIADAVLEHATTLALTMAHIAQESAGPTQTSYGAAAMVGTTAKWANAVEAYKIWGRV